MVGMAEFKANCTRLLREVGEGGEPITVTVRGKPVAVVAAPGEKPKQDAGHGPSAVFGMLKNDRYRFDDPFTPVSDMDEWEANNPSELYRRQ